MKRSTIGWFDRKYIVYLVKIGLNFLKRGNLNRSLTFLVTPLLFFTVNGRTFSCSFGRYH